MSGSRRRQQPEPAEPPANPSAPAPTRRSTRGHLGSTDTTSEFTITRSNVPPTNPLTGTNQPPHTPLPARQNLSSIPEVGSSHHTTVPILLHTPARRAAARMAVQLDSNIAMATPGPVEQRWQDTQESDPSDGGGNESDDSTDEFPVRLVRHRRTTADGTARQAQIVSPNSDDSELEELEPDVSVGAQRGRRARGQGGGGHRSAPALRGRASRGRGHATGRAQPDNTEVDFEPGPHPLRGRPAVTGGPPTGYTVDENGFTWADDSVLSGMTRAPDAKFFFGSHLESGSQKCRLCSVELSAVYAKTSSLSTK
ncbi:hypothetical protein DFH08DRAFT_795651 [Mycena albidolilacea]|uniref:Uncharacterized protein n=1 Tax=Mycena albidolilacea TaxID=1033008 RepID=A0AAD7AT16_9AGAR|nr:hypothetical protein DFH08DRAFT_795651 [Mycena albidolilacea]